MTPDIETAFEEWIGEQYVTLKSSPKYKLAAKSFAAGAEYGRKETVKIIKGEVG